MAAPPSWRSSTAGAEAAGARAGRALPPPRRTHGGARSQAPPVARVAPRRARPAREPARPTGRVLTKKFREVCGAEPEQHRPQRVHVGLQEQRPLGGMAARTEHEPATGSARSAVASSSRVLPIPPTPSTRTRCPTPAPASAHSRSSVASSVSRPTSAGRWVAASPPARLSVSPGSASSRRIARWSARSRQRDRSPARRGAGPRVRRTPRVRLRPIPHPPARASGSARLARRTGRRPLRRRRPRPPRRARWTSPPSASRWRVRRRRSSACRRTRRTQSASGSSGSAGGDPRRSRARRAAAAASAGSPAANRPAASSISAPASSRSTVHASSAMPYARPLAASTPSPSNRLLRLTSVATLAAGSAGGAEAQRASTTRSRGTMRPRSEASSASSVRALRLPRSRPVSVRSAVSTVSTEHSRIRTLRPRSPSRPCLRSVSPSRAGVTSLTRGGGLSVPSGRMIRCTSSARRPARGSPLPSRRPTPAQSWCLGCDLGGPPCPGGRPDRLRQDPLGVPVVDRPAGDRAGPGEEAPLPRALRLARSRRSPSTSSATCGRRWSASGRPPTGSGWRCPRSGSACAPGDTTSAGPAPDPDDPSRHPDHHPRVAVPDAHLAGARVAARGGDGDRRRGARRRRHQARRPPRALARAAR